METFINSLFHKISMDAAYVSVDIEASGRTPGKYTMLSLGACMVDNPHQTFYKELKPIVLTFDPAAMRVGSQGLRCLKPHLSRPDYNPDDPRFEPLKVLQLLQQKGASYTQSFQEFGDWVRKSSKGQRPVLVAAPIIFDGMWVQWYFDNFASTFNPFGHSGIDINSIYKGLTKNMDANIVDLNLREGQKSHNALEDAVQQALEFDHILKLLQHP